MSSTQKRSKRAVIKFSSLPRVEGLHGEELDRAVATLLAVLEADIRELFYEDRKGLLRLRKPEQLPSSILPAIKALHRDADGNLYYELHSKTDASKRLIPYIKALT